MEMRTTRSTLARLLCASVFLCLCSLCPGWQVYLLAEDACLTQWDYRAQCPFLDAIEPNEPNSPTGPEHIAEAVLTPIASDDPNLDPTELTTWERPVGRWYREAPLCLPTAGWSLDSIRCIDGTSVPTVTVDADAMTWGLATDVLSGPNWWAIEATSRNVADPRITKSRVVFVTCLGILDDTNAAPILAAITEFLEVS